MQHYRETEEALGQMERNKTRQAIATIVTTRGLGFCAAQIYFHASAQPNPVLCNIYSFYRVNLAMFETRLYEIREIQKLPLQILDKVFDVSLQPEILMITHAVKVHPVSVGRIIRATGPIEYGDEYYVPAAACNEKNQRGDIVPQSEHVLFSNLRAYVVALADEETPAVVREAFYLHNPIPGAVWRGEVGNHILDNPDEIIPPDYNVDGLRDDIDDYNRMMTWLQKKVPKFVCTNQIAYEAKGDRSIFISNSQENAKIIDRRAGEALSAYYQRMKIEGNIHEFWSQRSLKNIEELNGILMLAGELPSLENYMYPIYCGRDVRAAGWHYNADWKGIQQILYNS